MSNTLARRSAIIHHSRPFTANFRRCESTIVPNSFQRRKPPVHTHYLAIPMYDGSFMERVIQLRNLIREHASLAGLEPNAVMPNVKKSLLFRFGHVNIQDFKPNRPSPEQPSYQLNQVEEALEKAKARISAEIDQDSLTLLWGSISPVIPFVKEGQMGKPFNPALVRILHLRTQLSPAWDNVKKLQNIVFDELQLAGISNIKLRESTSVHLSIVNTKWTSTVVDGKQQIKPFNIKTLYTIPGFDQFRTAPLPTKDELLGRFTPVDLGTSNVKNFVLEEVGQDIKQINDDPVFTRTYEFA